MEYTTQELLEAKRQIASTVHKLRTVVQTLNAKEDPSRYQSQLTLATRRIAAFELAIDLIQAELERPSPSVNSNE